MSDRFVPPDQSERDRVVDRTDETLFVEAGAGSGKTTALVARILSLVRTGVELRSVAAITFTEKAGAELRDRLRQELERALQESDAADPGRYALALEQLDGAAIGTLHSFAQRLLSEHPIEAGLPPRIEVLDEVSSGVAFERRWAAFQDRLLADPACERSILLLLAAKVRTEAFRVLARTFDQSWDLVVERIPAEVPEPPRLHDLLGPVLDDVDRLCDERARCADVADKLSVRLDEIAEFVSGLRVMDDEIAILDRLTQAPSFRAGNLGTKANWGDAAELKAGLREVGDKLGGLAGEIAQAAAHRIGAAIARFTLAAAEERRAEGRLEFHDLLVLARSLVTDPVHGALARSTLHDRYRRILLDEFQDTDPIQIELAVRIAAADPAADLSGRAPWAEVPLAPGHLFVVGDPKQSIYRFRRADIATFLEARDRFAQVGGTASLTANFRTGEPLIDWVNHTFAALMSEPAETELELTSQPDYTPLQAVRPGPPDGPAVSLVGRSAHEIGTRADVVRAAEAADVAAAIARAIGEGWAVSAGRDDAGAGAEIWRPARLGDITVLVPARTSLPFLDDALGERGIPYRAESSSIVYATRAVRDLLMVLRAVDDPTNRLHAVAALRTPLYGCGDDDLARYRIEHGGVLSITAPVPDSVPHDDVVAAGLRDLRARHEERHWHTPSEMLGRIAVDRRAFELGFTEGRPRDVWRRYRFVIDQARAWHEATGGGLRDYLRWVSLQTAEGARVAESVLPETDDDAVRVMTIHAAKGLEFPITIVSGMSSLPNSQRAAAEVRFPRSGSVAYRLGPNVATTEFTATIPLDEQMGLDERIRLLYVATTRARDHLVVSLHRSARAAPPIPSRRTNAELLVDGMGDLVDSLDDAVDADLAANEAIASLRPEPPEPFDLWRAERDIALAGSSRPTTVAATALTDEGHADGADRADGEGTEDGDERVAGLQKRPRDLDLPPWLKGRYGTAVGRAVHGTLQTIDLASAHGLEAAVAAQCEAEAIPDRADTVEDLVRAALGSQVVQAAAAAPHWREVYACTPVGQRMLEGYVDLLYRSLGGLVVVDYKTAATSDPAELDRRVEGYRVQGASYALAVAAATAEPVDRVIFLFLTPNGAFERELRNLPAAVADVRERIIRGSEVEVGEPV